MLGLHQQHNVLHVQGGTHNKVSDAHLYQVSKRVQASKKQP